MQKKADQLKTVKNRTRQLHINFHNPNTTEDTAKYLSKLIVKNLESLKEVNDNEDNG